MRSVRFMMNRVRHVHKHRMHTYTHVRPCAHTHAPARWGKGFLNKLSHRTCIHRVCVHVHTRVSLCMHTPRVHVYAYTCVHMHYLHVHEHTYDV
jgi:hypothetical protein